MKTRQTSLPKLLSAVIAVQLLLCPWSDARQVPASDTSVSVAVTLKLEGDAKPSRMTLQLAELRAGPSPSRVTVRNMQLSPGANTFTLPIGHYRVVPPSDVNPGTFGMPFGYELKSMRSGTTDLVREPFELLKANAAHIEMTIGPVSKPAGIRPLNLVNIPGRFTSEMETVEGIVAVEGGGPAPFLACNLPALRSRGLNRSAAAHFKYRCQEAAIR